MAEQGTETPVLDLLAKMTADSIEVSGLDPETLMRPASLRSSRLMLLRPRTC